MSDSNFPPPRGRGARLNSPNRFESTHHEPELEQVEDDDEYLDSLSRPGTEFLPDRSRNVDRRERQPGRRVRGEPEPIPRV